MTRKDSFFDRLPDNLFIGPVFGPEEAEAVKALVEAGTITQLSTDTVEEFEVAFAAYIGVKEAVAVSSGTAAVHTALIAAGVEAGDEVIVPAFTFIGTVGPVLHQHAVPVFADIDPTTLCLAAEDVERKITDKTKAVLPVDLFGHPADLDAITAVAEKHGVTVVDDACQSHGAEYKGRRLGGLAPLTSFSFQESKNMTTGEGGMVTTNDPELAQVCRSVRHQGEQTWGLIARVGYNYRMTALQAAIGIEQLKKLDDFNTRRRAIAGCYTEALVSLGLQLPTEASYAKSVCHVYSFLLPKALAPRRDEILNALQQQGVPVSIAYPKPLYASPVFDGFAVQACPVTEDIASRVLTLPTAHSLSIETAGRIAEMTRSVLERYLT